MLSYDDLPADEAAMLKAAADEAERGYTDKQLEEAIRLGFGRQLEVGTASTANEIRMRIDDEPSSSTGDVVRR